MGLKSDLSTRAQNGLTTGSEGWQESTSRIQKAPRDKQEIQRGRSWGKELERGNKEHLSQRQNQPGEEGAKGKGEREVKEERGGKSMGARCGLGFCITAKSPERLCSESQSQTGSGTEGPERLEACPRFHCWEETEHDLSRPLPFFPSHHAPTSSSKDRD